LQRNGSRTSSSGRSRAHPRLGAAGSGNGGEAAAGGGVFRETSETKNFDPGRHWGGGSGGSNGGEGENQRG